MKVNVKTLIKCQLNTLVLMYSVDTLLTFTFIYYKDISWKQIECKATEMSINKQKFAVVFLIRSASNKHSFMGKSAISSTLLLSLVTIKRLSPTA